jgi:hypothetical protein
MDEKYLYENKYGMPALVSMGENSNIRSVFITVGFNISDELRERYPKIEYIRMEVEDQKAKNVNNCIQHGEFLKHIATAADDIIICADGDAPMQRGITSSEFEFLKDFHDGDIGLGWNHKEHGTLVDELKLMRFHAGINIVKQYYNINNYVFNAGVIVANRTTYEKLYNAYCNDWEKISTIIGHPAKQQFLISDVAQRKEFNHILLPYTFHSHAHFGPQGVLARDENNKITLNGEIVLFAHVLDRYV